MEPQRLLYVRCQVYLTAWTLQAELDEAVMEAQLACIAEDMQGF